MSKKIAGVPVDLATGFAALAKALLEANNDATSAALDLINIAATRAGRKIRKRINKAAEHRR